MSEGNKTKVENLKNEGNKALESGSIEEAINKYTEAIELEPSNHVLYSNRSAALAKSMKYKEALEDAEKTIEMNPSWPKGYSRKGTALCYLHRYEEASLAFEEGLKLDPNNKQMKDGLQDAKSKLSGPAGSSPIGNPFSDPNIMSKLEAHPKTREYLKQPDYRMMIELLRQSPGSMGNINDPRIMTTLGVLLGLDFDVIGGDGNIPEPMDIGDTSDLPPQSATSRANSNMSNNSPKHTSDKKKQDSSSESSDSKISPNLTQALEEKQKGNEAYKKKEFATAIKHYSKAIELDPVNIVFRNNLAAVHFEQGNFDECIKECEKAIEVGRENRADYKDTAKSFARIGKAYHKKEDLKQAVIFYNKSLSEHRTPETVKCVQEIEKKIKEEEAKAYINPEISQEEKDKGNDAFKKGKYPEAVKHYNEAIKRNPTDPKIFSNRAACYTKLLEFQLALKDCEDCIKLDSKFIKGYLRKGAILLAMKEPTKASQAYQKALDLDSNCKEAQDGYRNAVVQEGDDPEAIKKRAMSDPEVQSILQDPAMQLILQQMQKDPNALRDHLQNPEIAKKIEKLLECGIIGIR